MSEQLRTTCNRDCPDSCGVIVTVEDGRIVRHRGDPDHGITKGFLCKRGNRYLQRFYSSDRLLHPMRKSTSKSSGGSWQQIDWDDALELAAEQLQRHRRNHGPESVLVVSYSGIHGLVAKGVQKLFWRHFGGATFVEGGLSVEALHAAQHLDFGGDCTHAPEDLVHAEGLVVWGKNIAITRPHMMPLLNQARKNGAELHVIDPVRTSTAKRADAHYQLRPGSDGLLAMAIGRLLIERDGIDRDFVEACCHGFEDYQQLVMSRSLADVAKATGIDELRIEQLAQVYAERKPLTSMVGLGLGYWRNSGAAVRLIDALAAITGNVGIAGAGVHTDTSAGARELDLSWRDEGPRGRTRTALLPRLGAAIEEAADPPLKMAWIAGANPAATCPHTSSVRDGLRSLDFVVAVEQFMTASASEADLVLPCTTYLEMEDLIVAYGHNWLGLIQPVVPPLGEARSDVAIYQALAERLGFGDALAGEPADWIRKTLAPLEDRGVTREALAARSLLNPAAAQVPFADHRFTTPSGKVELTATDPGPPPALADGELQLMATKSLNMVNAQINAGDLPAEPVAKLHPEALAERGFADGEQAWVTSAVGRVRTRLAADPAVHRDVLELNPAAWRGDLEGVNQLREPALTDVAKAAAMHETRVTLVR